MCTVLQIGKIDDGVTVGVAASQVEGLHLDAAEKHRRLIGEDEAGRRRLLAFDHVRAGVAVGDDFGDVDEFGMPARMIAVMVRAEHVPDRL